MSLDSGSSLSAGEHFLSILEAKAIFYKSIGSRVLRFSKSTSRMPQPPQPRSSHLEDVSWVGTVDLVMQEPATSVGLRSQKEFFSQSGVHKGTLWVPCTSAVG